MDVNNTLSLVVIGFELNSLERFKESLRNKSFFKDKNFTQGREGLLPTPIGMPKVAVSYQIKNDKFLTIEYNLIEKKLTIVQNNYRENDLNQDAEIFDILKSLLTMAPSASISAFGINYSTDVIQEKKLCLFNPSIEEKLGQDYWDSNIGFNTELAFKSTDYITVYRIFKNEELSKKEGFRYYSFNCNFDFQLNIDDKAQKILDIFKNNNQYYDRYKQQRENILEL